MLLPRFIVGSKNRTKIKYLANHIPPWERDLFGGNARIEPWAFIRVHNEIKTIRQSLDSIKEVIKKGVISFHGCTDGTEDFVYEFCRENPGYIPYRYPYEVIPGGDPRYEKDVPYANTLAAYYNATLDLIPTGEWFFKVDADMVYFPEVLEKSFYIPSSEKDCVLYSRLDLVRKNGSLMVSGYWRPGDHWLIRKDDETYFENVKVFREGRICGYEVLNKGYRNIYCVECSALHFPFEKKWRNSLEGVLSFDLDSYIDKMPDYEIDKKIFTRQNIEEIYGNFNKNKI